MGRFEYVCVATVSDLLSLGRQLPVHLHHVWQPLAQVQLRECRCAL